MKALVSDSAQRRTDTAASKMHVRTPKRVPARDPVRGNAMAARRWFWRALSGSKGLRSHGCEAACAYRPPVGVATGRYTVTTVTVLDAADVVARNVRSLRAGAGLSLDALAARAEVSKGALVALESGRGNPNLTTLVRVADALGRSVSSLMEDREQDPVLLVDRDGVRPLWSGGSGGTATLLLTNPRPAPVEVWSWRLFPDERVESRPHPAGVSETLTVISGAMRLTLSERVWDLCAGQTILFPADQPHAYQGAGEGACEVLMTVHLAGDDPAGGLR